MTADNIENIINDIVKKQYESFDVKAERNEKRLVKKKKELYSKREKELIIILKEYKNFINRLNDFQNIYTAVNTTEKLLLLELFDRKLYFLAEKTGLSRQKTCFFIKYIGGSLDILRKNEPELYKLIELHYLQGISLKEISKKESISTKAIKTALSKGIYILLVYLIGYDIIRLKE